MPAQDHQDQEQHMTDMPAQNTCSHGALHCLITSLKSSLSRSLSHLRTSILSPWIGGPGRDRTDRWLMPSPVPSSDSMGERDWAAAIADGDGRRKRALRRQIAANSKVGAGMADWVSPLERVSGWERRRWILLSRVSYYFSVCMHWRHAAVSSCACLCFCVSVTQIFQSTLKT